MCLKAAIGVRSSRTKMGSQKRAGLLRIHVNMPATALADVAKALNNGDPAPAGLSDKEKAAFAFLNDGGHFHAYLSNTLS